MQTVTRGTGAAWALALALGGHLVGCGPGTHTGATHTGTTPVGGPPPPTCAGNTGTTILYGSRLSLCKGYCGPTIQVWGDRLTMSESDAYAGWSWSHTGRLTAAGRSTRDEATAAIDGSSPPGGFSPSGSFDVLALCRDENLEIWEHDASQPLPAPLEPAWAFVTAVWGPLSDCVANELVADITGC